VRRLGCRENGPGLQATEIKQLRTWNEK